MIAIHAKHIVNKLQRTRVQVEHAINNILFKADRGKYDDLKVHDAALLLIFHNAKIQILLLNIPSISFLDFSNYQTPSPLPSSSFSHASSTSLISNCPTAQSDT